MSRGVDECKPLPGTEASRRKALASTSDRVAAAVLGRVAGVVVVAARRGDVNGVVAIVTMCTARVWWFCVSTVVAVRFCGYSFSCRAR